MSLQDKLIKVLEILQEEGSNLQSDVTEISSHPELYVFTAKFDIWNEKTSNVLEQAFIQKQFYRMFSDVEYLGNAYVDSHSFEALRKGLIYKLDQKMNHLRTAISAAGSSRNTDLLPFEDYIPGIIKNNNNMKKIFISHSSKNTNYGQAIVDLLTSVGINSEQIIFTSNDAYGIPTGQNIYHWLKARISEKPHVIYLLSSAYYSSIACLNEMGAAWIVENEHTIIFTPEFRSTSPEFQSGALDPREMGFKINNHDRVVAFIENLRSTFSISTNAVLVGQKIREFIQKVDSFNIPIPSPPLKEIIMQQNNKVEDIAVKQNDVTLNRQEQSNINFVEESTKSSGKKHQNSSETPQVNKFLNDLLQGKLKDEEILLIHYIIDTARYRLGTGWKSSQEIENIKIWEDVHALNSKLSSGYDEAIRRLEVKKMIDVSEFTSSGNPREVILIQEFKDKLLDISNDQNEKIEEALARNEKVIPNDVW